MGDREYGWLYGGGSDDDDADQPTQAIRRPPASDPEPTRVMPTMGREAARGSDPARRATRPEPRRTPPPTKPARAGGSGRGRGAWGWAKLVLLLWLVFLLAVPLWAWTRVDKVDAEPSGGRPADQPGTNYLLVGSDSREGATKKELRELGLGMNETGQRTDTIMLLHVGDGPNVLLSIPRDSIVDIPGQGTTKINAAYAFGGPELLVRTVEQNTGLYIDNYVELGFLGLVDIVDAVGGVEICPKTAMRDPKAKLRIKRGCQEADGPTALGYARSRQLSNLGDIDRARRQREVVSAIGAKAKSPLTVLNPIRYFRTGKASSEAFGVGENVGPFDLLRFAFAMTRVDGESGLTCSMPIADLAVNWDADRASRLFRLLKQDRADDIKKSLCGPSGLPAR